MPAKPVISASQLFQLLKQGLVAARLAQRGERMEAAELRPGDRQHLRRRVQFHRAGAERDHRSRQRQVARLQPFEVAQHLGFRMVAVEDRMRRDSGWCGRAGRVIRLDFRGQVRRQ